MKTFGFAEAAKELRGWEADVEIRQRQVMDALCVKLAEWAAEEHDWRPDRPHTEGTIQAFVEEVTATTMTARLQADMDAGLWLELARDGRWAWLWPAIVNHWDEIAELLLGAGAWASQPERAGDIDGQYEAAKQDLEEAERQERHLSGISRERR